VSELRARPWTSHEDIVLQRLATAGKYAAAIAAEMNRSESAIRSRAKKLNITLARAQGRAEGEEMSLSTPARRQWTADEKKKLDDLLEAGKTAPEIAATLQRTPTSIYAQLQRLDIKKASRRLVELGLKVKK